MNLYRKFNSFSLHFFLFIFSVLRISLPLFTNAKDKIYEKIYDVGLGMRAFFLYFCTDSFV